MNDDEAYRHKTRWLLYLGQQRVLLQALTGVSLKPALTICLKKKRHFWANHKIIGPKKNKREKPKFFQIYYQEANGKKRCGKGFSWVLTCWFYGVKIGSISALRNNGSFFQIVLDGKHKKGLGAEVQKAEGLPFCSTQGTEAETNTQRRRVSS